MTNTRGLDPTLSASFDAKVVHPVLLADIELKTEVLRLWSGLGNLIWNGNTYQGAGGLVAVDVVPETTDLGVTNVRMSLNGIPSEYLAMVLNETEQSKYATLWFGTLHETTGNLIADPYQLFRGITDVPELEEGGDTCSITISCESKLADLNRAKVLYYTPEDQKLIDPTDKGFDFVAGLQNASIIFA